MRQVIFITLAGLLAVLGAWAFFVNERQSLYFALVTAVFSGKFAAYALFGEQSFPRDDA